MDLKQQTYIAIRATTLSYGLRFALQLLQIVILARLLQPSDFGVIAVSGSFLAILGILADFGIGRALIHFREISDGARSSLYWINLLLASLIAVVVAVTAPLAALLFKEPMVTTVLALNSLALPIAATGQQFLILAEKNLQFSVLAWLEIASALVGATVSITLALHGWGSYSIVWGILASAGTSSLLAWRFLSAGWVPKWHLDIEEVRPMLKFGAYLVGENMAGSLNREMDILVGGMAIGSGSMGFYAVARNIALKLAFTIINPIVTRVALPVMTQMQDDKVQLKSAYLSMLRMVSSINFPLYLLIGLFAADIVALLYGSGWDQAVFYLQILAAWGLVRSVSSPVGTLVVAVGRPKLAFWWNIGLLFITPGYLLAGAWLRGLEGLAWAVLALSLLTFVPMWRLLVYPLCGIRFHEYVQAALPPLSIAIASGIVALAAAYPIEHSIPKLLAGGTAFMLIYCLLSYKYNQPWLAAMRHLLFVR